MGIQWNSTKPIGFTWNPKWKPKQKQYNIANIYRFYDDDDDYNHDDDGDCDDDDDDVDDDDEIMKKKHHGPLVGH